MMISSRIYCQTEEKLPSVYQMQQFYRMFESKPWKRQTFVGARQLILDILLLPFCTNQRIKFKQNTVLVEIQYLYYR